MSVVTSQQTTPWLQQLGINSLCLFLSARWLSTSKASTGGSQPLLLSGAQAVGTALPDNTRDAAWEGAWWKAAASFLGSPAVRPGKLLCPSVLHL